MVVKLDERSTIRIRKGAAKTFLFSVTDADGDARDMTGETAVFSARVEIGDSVAVISKSLNGGETGASFSTGVVAVAITSADTADIDIPEGEFSIFLAWSLTVTTSGGTPLACLIGGKAAGLLEFEQKA